MQEGACMKTGLKLYNYFRSSASYRVRLALHWKGLEFEYIPVHLKNGKQHSAEYRKLNPMGHVPALVHGDFILAESVAIFDYLDRAWPERPVFPLDSQLRGRALQICEIVNSGIQPYQNLKVLADFEKRGWTQPQTEDWVRQWVMAGLANLEKVLEGSAGSYAVGGEVTAADMFIVPQLFGSRRFKIDIAQYPILSRIEEKVCALDPFKKAHPEKQIDFEK